MLRTSIFIINLSNQAMNDRTEILRLLMKQVGISSFQILSERTGISRRAIDTLRKGNAATLRYADLAKLAEVLQIEVTEVIAKFISDSNNPESPISEIAALREEYQRLQQKLELQKFELRSQFERETIQQLESLILQLPSAGYAAQQNPNMLAKNILPLLRPIDALLQKWGITAIGAVGKEVNFDSQKHQLMEGSDEIKEGDIAIVRYVGYMQGEKLLYRARVSIAI
ncbi:MAG: nucleotide exchange factor GrpE [Pseudanabaena sp. M135S2SP2A07QC]|nr:nucleotide exchange factor GrpE [Pseudanabaena sp. M090S1SP2A07QC]MCA6508078.1 nucleotide exchange factor GrpE [Pseudanabaena sp. M172S2SP2A07QC]MCA6521424.1 nucleotide exchange factor GrpE [Pseudanabaena sp. M051S1SP2A07QC]MCA6524962.1 nucleotide exchange factor GrpE [Pseudanabaena sp. M179S2SP2A07QC]MCA6531483.1 nucleotide exchange factor GrpE [Pseudanabaena sp. M125S2SP2A07QC]MCA6534235.1 nucleotide exchange factor GrpE [Pseudanabaena sp. M176S2SP2A07QC]MCA6539925.1 nucleotide exchange 